MPSISCRRVHVSHPTRPDRLTWDSPAAAFAEKLPETAAELYMNDASDEDLAKAEKLPASSIDAST
ncbi:hypothetical protein ACIGXF_36795 [Streptomyces sp. NPDC053086]